MQFLRKIVFPISLIYALVVYLRNSCYNLGIFKSTSFKTPLVCIGNLSVGGTGKTPMTEYLIRLLKDDYKTAILSRGYRRKTKGFLLANETLKVEELGDEPYQIYSKFKGITLAVDGDRTNGILKLEAKVQPDIILLDDAFQHRKVKPSLSILLTTYSNLYVHDWYLPTGDLRDNKKEAQRANVIVVTKCPLSITESKKQDIIELIKPKKHQKVLFSKLVYEDFLVGSNGEIPLSDIEGRDYALVTAIANPEPFVTYLRSMGHSFEHFKYADHHFFNADDIARFSNKDFIITTEKDYTKLKVSSCKNLFYLAVKHEFFDEGKKIINEEIKKIMSS